MLFRSGPIQSGDVAASVPSVSQREAGKCVSVWFWGAKRCDLKLQRGQTVRAEEVLSLGLCPGENEYVRFVGVRSSVCLPGCSFECVCQCVSFCLVLLRGLHV